MSSAPRSNWRSPRGDGRLDMSWGTESPTSDTIAGSRENGAAKSSEATPFKPLSLELGQESKEIDFFVPFKIVQRYPHTFVGKGNKDEVAQFFRDTLLTERVWDFFCQHDPLTARDPLLLVPTTQFKQYLGIVNSRLQKVLSIPGGGARGRFFLSFGELDTPRPRYLGRVNSLETLDAIKKTASVLQPPDLGRFPSASSEFFREKMEKIYNMLKTRTKKDEEKLKEKRLARQKGYSRMLKRVQRYLGLRQAISHASLAHGGAPRSIWDVTKPAPFKTRESVRFVCVDVESWEKNHGLVTEVGLAILDTKDIENLPPGKNGEAWFKKIETHHLIIQERRNLINHKYVKGCPDAFNFGKSEVVSIKEIDKAVGRIIGDLESEDKRSVIFVGHAIAEDLKYLMKIGYNHWRVPQIVDEVDTKDMFQRMSLSNNGRGLSGICSELGIHGRNYHNAGNDAAYTLQAMIAMAVKRAAGGPDKENASTPAIDEWSDGDMDDGGQPQRSKPAADEMQLPYRPSADNSENIRW
ncbi:hypothetical protein F5Y17DRAFT_478627 [Xylariaceae sp. FL0594]|nr:hypothetical protein F5Y17DRAFT_478627 [Xylariaceae sp. FL0594]